MFWATQTRSADFQVCCLAGFQTGPGQDVQRAADLEIGDTAGLETCATGFCADFSKKLPAFVLCNQL